MLESMFHVLGFLSPVVGHKGLSNIVRAFYQLLESFQGSTHHRVFPGVEGHYKLSRLVFTFVEFSYVLSELSAGG
jgi:hypothetical protein